MGNQHDGFRNNIVWKVCERIQQAILIITVTACVVIIGIEVFMRYFLKANFLGYDELLLFAAMWMYFIGGSYAMSRREHISADLLGMICKAPKTLQTLRAIVSAVTFGLSVVMVVWSFQYLQYAMGRAAHSTVLHIPLILSQVSLFVGYLGCAVYLLFQAYEDFTRIGPAGEGAILSGDSGAGGEPS